MATALARVHGTVLDVQNISGTSKAGNPYRMTDVSILIERRAVTTVRWPNDGPAAPPIEAEVDLLVEVDSFRDEPQFRAVKDMLTGDNFPR